MEVDSTEHRTNEINLTCEPNESRTKNVTYFNITLKFHLLRKITHELAWISVAAEMGNIHQPKSMVVFLVPDHDAIHT
jgi:hypothetical protein